MQRVTTETRQRALKIATGALVGKVGGIEAAASLVERGKSTVHRWTDRNDAEHFISVRDVAALEELGGDAPVTRLLCKLAGGLFVPHLDMGADEGSPAWLAMQLAQRLGQVSGEIARGLADDGLINRAEAERVEILLDEHDKVSAQLRSALRAIREAEADGAADPSLMNAAGG